VKLYGAIASPYVARVMMFAQIKGIDLSLEETPGGSPRSEEYQALTPIGRMPTLDVDGQIIAESEVICEYLEQIHPEPPGLPADAMDRAISRMVSRIVDLYIAPHVSPMVHQVNPETRDQAIVDENKAAFEKGFHYLEFFMGDGPFAVSDRPTLGDAAAAPYMMLLKKLVFVNFDEIADPTEGDGRLAVWWQAIEGNEDCYGIVQEYATAVEGFLKFLYERLAQNS
jgi:glutathione S-transferase